MKRANVVRRLLPAVLGAALFAPAAFACGEGVFHMGEGLRFQGYIAPQPATLLVFDDDRAPPQERMAVYRGLVEAGHSVSIAHDAEELAQALGERDYDVVIAALEHVDTVTAATGSAAGARLLPVVPRSRLDAALRERFGLVLREDASLGQYLRHINRLLGS